MCSLHFENNLLSSEGVRFASISKKTPLSKRSFAFVSLALPLLRVTDHNSSLSTYDLYGPVGNTSDAGKSITRASGRWLGPENRDFFGPCEMASSR